MIDIDEKVFRYTLDFANSKGMKVDPEALQDGISRHLASARAVVSAATLERLGHTHLALMINTAAPLGLTLGEVLMESLRLGSTPVAQVCQALHARKQHAPSQAKPSAHSRARKHPGKPKLSLVADTGSALH